MAPVYFMFRMFVGLIRQAYGFDGEKPDEEPPLRVCDECHSTVLEPEFGHCPYCGKVLPDTTHWVENRSDA